MTGNMTGDRPETGRRTGNLTGDWTGDDARRSADSRVSPRVISRARARLAARRGAIAVAVGVVEGPGRAGEQDESLAIIGVCYLRARRVGRSRREVFFRRGVRVANAGRAVGRHLEGQPRRRHDREGARDQPVVVGCDEEAVGAEGRVPRHLPLRRVGTGITDAPDDLQALVVSGCRPRIAAQPLRRHKRVAQPHVESLGAALPGVGGTRQALGPGRLGLRARARRPRTERRRRVDDVVAGVGIVRHWGKATGGEGSREDAELLLEERRGFAAVQHRPTLIVLFVVLLRGDEVAEVLVGEPGDLDAGDTGGRCGEHARAHPAAHLHGHLAGDSSDQPLPHAGDEQRHGLGRRPRAHEAGGHDDLVALCRICREVDRAAATLERLLGGVVQQPPPLLATGEQRQARCRLGRDVAARGALTAKADPRPAGGQLRGGRHRCASCLPGNEHLGGLHPTHLVGSCRPGAGESSGLVALVGVAVGIDDVLTSWNCASSAQRGLDDARRRAVVVGVVDAVGELVHGALVGERRPQADRPERAADLLVDPQHLHLGVDRVDVAQRVVGHLPGAEGLTDRVIGEVGLEAAIGRQAGQGGRGPPDLGSRPVVVRTRDGLHQLADLEGIELRVERAGDVLHGQCRAGAEDGVVGAEVVIAAGRRMGGAGRHDDVALAKPPPGKRYSGGLDDAARDTAQVSGYERELLTPPREHDGAVLDPRVHPPEHGVAAHPALHVVAGRCGDVRAPYARLERRLDGLSGGERERAEKQQYGDDNCGGTAHGGAHYRRPRRALCGRDRPRRTVARRDEQNRRR